MKIDDDERQEEKLAVAARLERDLKLAAGLRRIAAADPVHAAERDHLRVWQAGRLAASYPGLLESPRYGAAAEFFLSDLYGPKDFSARDAEVERILPMLVKTLPLSGLSTLALAIELDALSEDLDAGMVDVLRQRGKASTIDEVAYALAYRTVGRRSARLRQIQLIVDTGEALEALARKPWVAGALALMKGPAHLAGLGDLHAFLERGFSTFKRMGKAGEFLERIEAEETLLMNRWLAG
ncbi:MAG: hypothetical protein WC023_00210 [Rhodocyclaceae bacterium]